MPQLYDKANQSKRFVAYVIDWFIGALVLMLPVSIYYLAKTQDIESVSNVNIVTISSSFGEATAIFLGIISIVGGLVYYVLIPYITDGQSIGKRILELKIVNEDESSVGFKNILIRQLVILIIFETYLFSVSHMIVYITELITHVEMVKYFYSFGILVSAISCLLVAFTHEHLALHDIVSKTKVVGIVSKREDQKI